ncbi:TonB-dependent receptor [Exilibacterium tricleocarpae]|uniref:TonB-dependent receptor n=1 Tax=Exilibacterium tricleocarpae TaxID=2591008 RepID=A0A545T048_9GAMM|nr:TonB-dependent receptor [Exilibacterium tricleocarpae]TQV70593.1 TonB-dependent receptor [Exilibacterium tricleocarpae]
MYISLLAPSFLIGLLLALPNVADAQTRSAGPTSETQSQEGSLFKNETVIDDEIVVTGTAIRGIAPPATPVMIFDKQDIADSGVPSLSEFLQRVPQNTGGGSASEEGRSLGAFFAGSAISLRGFGSQRTLTLLNGNRIAPQGDGVFVDIAFIPAAAVEMVEIVPVGASSLYGADAVGGVVNFRLRDDYEGFETQLVTGATTSGDAATTVNFTQSAATAWDTGNALIVYDYFDQGGILAGDRDFTGPGLSETTLVPEIERHSVVTSLRQNLAERTTVLFDGYFVSSETARQSQFPFVGANLPLEENIETDAFGGTLTLQHRLGETWLAQGIATYSENDLNGFDIDTSTGKPTNIFGNEAFARFNRTSVLEAKADGELFDLSGGAVKLAVGGQFREERFDRDLGGTFPVSRYKRDVHAAYGELFVPLVGVQNRRPGVERLELSVSARYEDFGDADESLSTGEKSKRGGSTDSFDPQFGLLYAPSPDLALRASYGKSFTVAPLTTLRQNTRLTASTLLALDEPLDGAPNTLTVSGVDPDLGPETSTYWTLGADWTPSGVEGLRLSVTYYDIDLEDVLGRPTGSRNPSSPLIADFVVLNPTVAQIEETVDATGLTIDDIIAFGSGATAFAERGLASIGAIYQASTTNLSRQLYRGFDLIADYATQTAWGRAGATANIVFITDFEEQTSPGQPVVDRLSTPFQPIDLRARLGGFLERGAYRGNLFVNYTDSYEDNRFATARDVSSFVTVDASLSYDFSGHGQVSDGLRVQLSVQNFFDRDPPELLGLTQENNRFTGELGYDFVNASARGRFVSLAVTKSW